MKALNTVQQNETTIYATDDHPISVTIYSSPSPKSVLVIASALAAAQSFYRGFSEAFAAAGIDCITFDYRGTGRSIADHYRQTIRIEDWGQQDLEAVLQYTFNAYSDDTPVHLLGHSIGGQLVGMAQSATKLSRIIHVASSAPYWRRWPLSMGLKMLFLGKLAIPALSAFRNEFPSEKVGLGKMRVPTSITKQWASWMSRPEYLFDSKFGFDLSGYQALEQPLLALGFSDDELAPEQNINALLHNFPNVSVDYWQIDTKELGLGPIRHSGFFKSKFQGNLWERVIDWLLIPKTK